MSITTIADAQERLRAEQDRADVESIRAVQSLLSVVCKTTGLGFSAVARVTDAHWTAMAVQDDVGFGLAAGQSLVLDTTLCTESRAARQAIVIDHASQDPVYASHHTPRLYGIESYISVPIILSDDSYFGNLCALDARPFNVSQRHIVEMFEIYAQLIADQLSRIRRVRLAESEARQERETGLLREQFIAVLAHDLRNPLAAIDAGMAVLRQMGDSPPVREAVMARLARSSRRMRQLIEDLVDYARGRLGEGVELEMSSIHDLGDALGHAVEELQESHPAREITVDVHIPRPVRGNKARLQQVVSNLVSNALVHGAPGHPVSVTAHLSETALHIQVANQGNPIPAALIPKLFDAFSTTAKNDAERLGLGLFICSQVVQAHQGSIEVSSGDQGTVFCVTIPALAVH